MVKGAVFHREVSSLAVQLYLCGSLPDYPPTLHILLHSIQTPHSQIAIMVLCAESIRVCSVLLSCCASGTCVVARSACSDAQKRRAMRSLGGDGRPSP